MPLVVERTMTWAFGQRRGGHNSPGVLATAPTWYLAEGVTGFFDTFILITNPDPNQDAEIEVKYLREFSGTAHADAEACRRTAATRFR